MLFFAKTAFSLFVILIVLFFMIFSGTALIVAFARLNGHYLFEELSTYLLRAGKKPSFLNMVGAALFIPGAQCLFLVRVNEYLRIKGFPEIILLILKRLNKFITGSEISPHAEIGKGLQIFHGHGIVIVPGVKIGRNAWIFHNVTIGNRMSDGACPEIGDDVYVFTGAVIAGRAKVGNNVIIGAYSVISGDVPSDTVIKPPEPLIEANYYAGLR